MHHSPNYLTPVVMDSFRCSFIHLSICCVIHWFRSTEMCTTESSGELYLCRQIRLQRTTWRTFQRIPLFRCNDVRLFYVLQQCRLNIFRFWTAGPKKKKLFLVSRHLKLTQFHFFFLLFSVLRYNELNIFSFQRHQAIWGHHIELEGNGDDPHGGKFGYYSSSKTERVQVK